MKTGSLKDKVKKVSGEWIRRMGMKKGKWMQQPMGKGIKSRV
jgi:hypothetical protein